MNKIKVLIFLNLLLFITACFIFFIDFNGAKFWNFDYKLFLSFLLLIPIFLCVRAKSKIPYILRPLILLASLSLFGFLQMACPRPTGALELSLIHFLDEKPILMHLIKLGVLILVTFLFGRYFCGWICPKGIIQEYLYQKSIAFKPNKRVDKILKYGKYLTLVLLIVFAIFFDYRLFRTIGPFKVIFNLDGSLPLLIFLFVTLISSIFIERAYCRYFCPIGGLLAILSKFSLFKIRSDKIHSDDNDCVKVCNACGLCAKICPVDAIECDKGLSMKISSSECIVCRECERTCNRNSIRFI